jgi:hypothetical protein
MNVNDSVIFDVRDNDYFGSCDKGALTAFDAIAGSGLNHGVLTFNPVDSSYKYKPATNFMGVDSFSYYIKCDPDSSAAKVYILMQQARSQKYIACPGASVEMGFTAITGVSYYWYEDENGGTVISAANPASTLTVVKDSPDDKGTWWVEPRYGSIVFPRYLIELEKGDCHVTDPQDCAKDGTVLFKEDFGGNSPDDPEYKPEGIPEMDPDVYTYNIGKCINKGEVINEGYPCLDGGEYMIAKIGEPHYNGDWARIYDHTHPETGNRGYFLEVNADWVKGQFYERTIDGLCEGMTLYFSAWINNVLVHQANPDTNPGHIDHVNQVFVLEDVDKNRIAEYYTGDILNGIETGWQQYGFRFTVPANLSSLRLRIINNGTGSDGNDFALDDIEIRLCAPRVNTNIINNDTTVCFGNSLDIVGTYIEDCTFGDDLAYKWEFRHRDSVSWKELDADDVTVDCDADDPADRTVEKTVSIAKASKADEGYYRMIVSSQAHINSVNCRAASDSVYVRIVDRFVAPDIRMQVCPSPPNRTVQLSSFMDSIDYYSILWQKVTPSSPNIQNPATGLINDGYFHKKTTYTYRYTLLPPETSGCASTSAKVYIKVLDDRILLKTDTVVICQAVDLSKSVQLNQIFGLALGGELKYDVPVNPDNTVKDNIRKHSSSEYSGSLTFNAQKAYHEAGASYDITYRGIAAKKFNFEYTDSCITGTKRIVLIVTE